MLTDNRYERFDCAIGAAVGIGRIRNFRSLALYAVSRRVELGMIRHCPLGTDLGHGGSEPDGDPGDGSSRSAAPTH